MKKYSLGKFIILAPEQMLVLFNEDNTIIATIDRIEKEVHCIIELRDDKLFIDNGWNIRYSLNGNELGLIYNSISED